MTRVSDREPSESRMRRLSQRALELRTFQRLVRAAHIDLRGKELLDAGCGNGFGLEQLAKTFKPARLVGFDPSPAQIERARRRNLNAELAVGDLARIAEPDATFDGAFVFGILHHVPAWRAALAELARVLRPGGVVLVETIHDAGFDLTQFMTAMADAGLAIAGEQKLPGSPLRSFAAVKR
jgi:ubiquinone/menaquinone biosynthesis C-methylase UbiE